jgi:HTH-type transcriptional regulator/antitoxin MqsA
MHVGLHGWWCTACEEAIFDGEALAARERAFLELKAEVDEVLGPKDVARVRESLGLSQRAAGELLGGGPRAFQKYEAGKQAVSTPMSNLLRLLANDPARLDELLSGRKNPPSTRPLKSRQAVGRRTIPKNKKKSAGAR